MPISDFDIQHLAHLFIQLDGEQAIAKARKMVEERGDDGLSSLTKTKMSMSTFLPSRANGKAMRV